MGYSQKNGMYADVDDANLGGGAGVVSASGARTSFPTDRGTARLTLAVTAVSGTNPTLDVVIETSQDEVTWRTVAAFAQATDVGSERKCFVGLDRYVRANETLGGTGGPTVTRTIIGEFV